jgi:threonine synthase
MKYFNLKHPEERASFSEATTRGLGTDRGLFHPESIPRVDASALLSMPRFERYNALLAPFMSPDFTKAHINAMIKAAFTFEAQVVRVGEAFALELFHGPTLAFKDFGARWMAQCLSRIRGDAPMTILTATSGDTGAAVAHALRGAPGIRVVILYPKGKISQAQEQLFCTLGGNIETIAVHGSFDDCQALVKSAFDTEELRSGLGLNSANSINVSRLVAQILYYWDLVAALRATGEFGDLVVSVPSGNFGDLTAGLIAKAMGAPISRFIAATNANDTVPRYVANGRWEPNPTVSTASNAMDVSQPNNWPRTERLLVDNDWKLEAVSVDEAATVTSIKRMDAMGYIGEPHGAVAYEALRQSLRPGETGAFLCTAHPAKFADSVEAALGRKITIPQTIVEALDRKNLSVEMTVDSEALKRYLLENRA